MALIPYQDLPQPHDPPLVVAGQPVQEFYCGDSRCDCATAHVLFADIPMTVDLGTTSVELVNNDQTSPARQTLTQTLRTALRAGAIDTLRSHYAKVREYGREQHFRYVDWTSFKQGDLVAWEQIFRPESVPLWTMTIGPKPSPEAAASPPATDGEAGSPPQSFLLGLADSYCIEPKCDCNRVVWNVLTAPTGQPNATQALGSVELSFASGTPAVLRHANNIDPNQLFLLVQNLLRGQPQLADQYQQRYRLIRQHLTPILTAQRRQKLAGPRGPSAGRNDPCPCGSGKKFKKCHGQ
jgi:hypothetical protein